MFVEPSGFTAGDLISRFKSVNKFDSLGQQVAQLLDSF
jgi:hypothetical protein